MMITQELSNIIRGLRGFFLVDVVDVGSILPLGPLPRKPWVTLIASASFHLIVNSSLARRKIPEYYSCSLTKCRQMTFVSLG